MTRTPAAVRPAAAEESCSADASVSRRLHAGDETRRERSHHACFTRGAKPALPRVLNDAISARTLAYALPRSLRRLSDYRRCDSPPFLRHATSRLMRRDTPPMRVQPRRIGAARCRPRDTSYARGPLQRPGAAAFAEGDTASDIYGTAGDVPCRLRVRDRPRIFAQPSRLTRHATPAEFLLLEQARFIWLSLRVRMQAMPRDRQARR